MNNDLISRYALKKTFDEYGEKAKFTQGACQQLIDNAPPIEYTFEEAFQNTVCENKLYCPKRPQGKWEIVDAEGVKIWKCVCTECGHDPQEYIAGTEDWWLRKHNLPNYCPNCGADMRGGEEE